MSDALAIEMLFTNAKVAHSEDKAAMLALEAGLQFELSPQQPAMLPTLVKAENGSEVVELVDKAVRSVLQLKSATGAFNLPLPSMETLESTLRASNHLETNWAMCREAIVLLQNDGILPLSDGSSTKVALLGPFADPIHVGSYAANQVFNCTLASLSAIV